MDRDQRFMTVSAHPVIPAFVSTLTINELRKSIPKTSTLMSVTFTFPRPQVSLCFIPPCALTSGSQRGRTRMTGISGRDLACDESRGFSLSIARAVAVSIFIFLMTSAIPAVFVPEHSISIALVSLAMLGHTSLTANILAFPADVFPKLVDHYSYKPV